MDGKSHYTERNSDLYLRIAGASCRVVIRPCRGSIALRQQRGDLLDQHPDDKRLLDPSRRPGIDQLASLPSQGIPCHQDHLDLGETVPHPSVQVPSAHPWHDQVTDDQVDLAPILLDHVHRLRAVRCEENLVVEVFQRLAQGFTDGWVVLGDEDRLPLPVGRGISIGSTNGRVSDRIRGKWISNVVPTPTLLFTSM